MPELPEVESLRRALAKRLVGSAVLQASVARADVLHTQPGAPAVPMPRGSHVVALHRHGKQLVIETRSHGCLLVHLGMSGSLRLLPDAASDERHVHAWWRLRQAQGDVFRLRHRDPRRFGWLESHADLESVRAHSWSRLGPDALDIDHATLQSALAGTHRPLKAALLDQGCVAGLGNIYVDEALFRARLHPAMRTHRLSPTHVRRLAECVRVVLRKAVELGGSTIQDHRTAEGAWGSFQRLHRVYGRAGLPCFRCGGPLQGSRMQQRATVHCPVCQPRRPR